MQRIAIIGAGFIGAAHAMACSNSDVLELVAVCDTNEVTGQALAKKYECAFFTGEETMLEELRDEIDIVDVCVPTFLHKHCVLIAANHKKHIVCEKPIALTLEDADEIIEAVRNAGVKLLVAQVLRFWPEYVEIKRMVEDFEFGRVKMVYANRLSQPPSWAPWQTDPDKSGGALFDLTIHDIDAVVWLFGPVRRVYAVAWQSETGCYNHIVTTLTLESGVRAVVEGSLEMSESYPFTMTMRIVGANKTADFSMSAGFNIDDLDSARRDLFVYEKGKYPVKTWVDVTADAYKTQLDYFAECLEKGVAPTTITPKQTREVLRIILAIKESIETGNVISI